jgi:hypothetical protein
MTEQKLPPQYPAWWCCPVGKTRIEKAAEPSEFHGGDIHMLNIKWCSSVPHSQRDLKFYGLTQETYDPRIGYTVRRQN